MSEEEKKRLKENQKNYREVKKCQYIIYNNIYDNIQYIIIK